ncbi:sigma-70 family RNA polymerase sigma factor [Bacillus cereus]|uniref:sigma-70 family RNA polymerase sigma factor n=1 Tax=Bacillus cereus TaxID=1396 RepID=UPI00356E3AF4
MKSSYTVMNREDSLNQTVAYKSATKNPKFDLSSDNQYYLEIGRYKTLSREESIELFRRYKNGEYNLKEELFNYNAKLVSRIAVIYKHKNPDIEYLELIQEGNIGMLRAIEDYNPELGYSFSTYADWWIKSEIIRFIFKKRSGIFKLPNSVINYNNRYMEIEEEFLTTKNRLPSVEEVANILNEPIENVIRHNNIYRNQIAISLDTSKHDEAQTLHGCLGANDSTFNNLNEVLLEELDYEIWKIFNKVLNPRQKIVLNYAFGIEDGRMYHYKEIAKVLNRSTERISQLKNEAIDALRNCKYKDKIFTLLNEKIELMGNVKK